MQPTILHSPERVAAPASARAVVIEGPHQFGLRDVALAPAGPDDAVIAVRYTSISVGTEKMLLDGRLPHPMLAFPVVPGYETVGQVVGGGENMPDDMLGQWVYVGGARCYADVNPAWGGQSSVLLADWRRIVPLEGITPQQGVLLALAATALHGIDVVDVKAGQRVLVLGQGPVGQLAARIARARGAWVATCDRVAQRLAISDADLRIDARETGAFGALDAPVDVIIDATGAMEALASTLPHLAQNGTILLLGYYDELRLPYMPLFLKQARLLTAKEWAAGDLAECRDMIASGALDVTPLMTHSFAIDDLHTAYDTAFNNPDCIKLVLDWSAQQA